MKSAFICLSLPVQLFNCIRKPKVELERTWIKNLKNFVHLCEGQVKSVREFHEEMESMRDKIKEWKARNKDFEEETKDI